MNDRVNRPTGPARVFLAELEASIAEHPALSHPFLQRFASEKLDRQRIADFAAQHYMYSRFFVRNLAAVVSNVPDEFARSLLIQNMYEEVGEPLKLRDRAHLILLETGLVTPQQVAAALTVVGVGGDVTYHLVETGAVKREVLASLMKSREEQTKDLTHPALFRRFLRSLGVSPESIGAIEPLPETAQFVREYESVCRQGHWLEAMGALGPGTECVVPQIYSYLLKGIVSSDQVRQEDYVFWTIHVHCDEGHGENILLAIESYLDRQENRQLVVKGVNRVLNARKLWFDGLERHVFRPRKRSTNPAGEFAS